MLIYHWGDNLNIINKIKKLDIRLTEIATYLNYSRPSIYKFLEDYQNTRFAGLPHIVKETFDFIVKTSTINKLSVIEFIIQYSNQYQSIFESLKKNQVFIEFINKNQNSSNEDIVEKITQKLMGDK